MAARTTRVRKLTSSVSRCVPVITSCDTLFWLWLQFLFCHWLNSSRVFLRQQDNFLGLRKISERKTRWKRRDVPLLCCTTDNIMKRLAWGQSIQQLLPGDGCWYWCNEGRCYWYQSVTCVKLLVNANKNRLATLAKQYAPEARGVGHCVDLCCFCLPACAADVRKKHQTSFQSSACLRERAERRTPRVWFGYFFNQSVVSSRWRKVAQSGKLMFGCQHLPSHDSDGDDNFNRKQQKQQKQSHCRGEMCTNVRHCRGSRTSLQDNKDNRNTSTTNNNN